jgi:hypothetical protein
MAKLSFRRLKYWEVLRRPFRLLPLQAQFGMRMTIREVSGDSASTSGAGVTRVMTKDSPGGLWLTFSIYKFWSVSKRSLAIRCAYLPTLKLSDSTIRNHLPDPLGTKNSHCWYIPHQVT